ncbi:hypothetical protein JJL45_15475 [Tamlana sp. s12]|uniref:hypothetical protein n=1 Tax=Tamlana sp. s12 TaxID=1630406 RepID=UPI0007FB7FE2|nr:hypothetical protein [Tamlana sp. s12]OBQ52190.1 hypothetical protein VQ01_13985 [Tamlana sp. s12]QQY82295.1 hypothetical protein JJL45_15475 [Tamlana sp. s12]
MKHIIALFCLAILFTSCEGDQGPAGPVGPPGEDGLVGLAFEIEIDFDQANNFEHIEPYGFDVLPSDVVLTYISWETDNGTEIWRLLPQTAFLQNNAILTYNFDFTQGDVRIFLDSNGTFNLVDLTPEWTDNQLFRVVVVPADFISGIDTNNLDAVMKATNIEQFKSL